MKFGSYWGVYTLSHIPQHRLISCREQFKWDKPYCITLILAQKGKNGFQNATCTPRVKLLKLSLKFWCSLKRYDVFLKHSFFMLVRSWMMCNFILMRNFRYWRSCNSNDRRLLSMVALMIDDIKHLIEIEPNTKISKLIHKMRVFQSIGILKWHLKKVFAVLCVLLFMTYHWYQDGWNWVKSHVSEIPSSSRLEVLDHQRYG